MHSRRLLVLCASVFPLMVCSGMVYSILALYISELGATKTHIGLIYMTGSAAGAFLAPVLGRLSDRIGRRPIMLLSMGGFTIAFLLYGFIIRFEQAFIIQAFEGLTWAAMGVTVTAYIADITPVEKRGWGMGIYERTWSIGWIVGPVFGGFLADTIGFRTTFIISSSLIVFGLILMLLYVEESKIRVGKYVDVGNVIHAFVLIGTAPSKYREVEDVVSKIEGIKEIHPVAGIYNAVAILEVPKLELIDEIVTGKIKPIEGVSKILSLVRTH